MASVGQAIATASQNFAVAGGVEIGKAFAEFELLARMLDPNPKTRITPTEALNHNYFEKFFVPRLPIGKENYNENLSKFSSKSGKTYGRQ
jgi:hypothetical protein